MVTPDSWLFCPRGSPGRSDCTGQPFPSPGDLPDPGTEPTSPALQADSLPSAPPGKPNWFFSYVPPTSSLSQASPVLPSQFQRQLVLSVPGPSEPGTSRLTSLIPSLRFCLLGSASSVTTCPPASHLIAGNLIAVTLPWYSCPSGLMSLKWPLSLVVLRFPIWCVSY